MSVEKLCNAGKNQES